MKPVSWRIINLSRNYSILSRSRLIPVAILGYILTLGISTKGQDITSKYRNMGGAKKGDSTLQHRVEDSITINYRFLDSSRLRKLDSSVYDFSKKNPMQPTYINLGNFGTPTRDLVFTPKMNSGWDAGWHSYDPYLFTVDETRLFTTTKPYTELGYLLGSKSEQMINLMHTQNIRPNINAAFQYRLINVPGTYNNQNTNHNNYRFSVWYQSKNKRYQAFLIIVGSKLEASDNGGIRSKEQLDTLPFGDKINVFTWLGVQQQPAINPFSINISTGTTYSTGTYLLRQQYDIIGKKDSIVTDSSVTPLFYPKFRAEYNIQYSTYHYKFNDNNPDTGARYYVNFFDFISTPDTVRLSDYWKELINDFSLYQFPDNKNPQQFFKAGAALQNLNGNFAAGSETFYNVFLHGEYRNKTHNQKWDIEAIGKFFIVGENAGDYNAYISLKRQISRNLGYLQLGFQNVNRTPSFAFQRESSFGFGNTQTFGKENTTNFFGSYENTKIGLKLSGSYYLLTNYTYFHDYYKSAQETTPFNLLQARADKIFKLHKNWVWRMSLILQQKTGATPLNIPFLVTFNQIGYEGNLGFRNLLIAFGAEVRYYTGYKADGYAPPIGQFFYQNNETIRQNFPDINAYVHFRIKGFTAYVRAENLNTFQFKGANGPGFTNYNFVAPNYPYPGLLLRVGIFWSFIN